MTLVDFIEAMLKFLPSELRAYEESVKHYGKLLETVVIEDVIMRRVVRLLEENSEKELLANIFEYFEKISNTADAFLLDNFAVTVLEVLGNDKEVLGVAQTYMGRKTYELQLEADKSLGRVR